jgi:crotonobetainyl-CoA:carnitine CoA-transferase CaiB-like acyl-CoA transferase
VSDTPDPVHAQVNKASRSGPAVDLPLDGVIVVDFSQYLAGPVATLRLADLGARVIKVERPGPGDAGRDLAFAGLRVAGASLSFHVMNRGKESFAADLKVAAQRDEVKQLLAISDVLVHNFRPGVMARLGLDYASLRELYPRLVYANVSGFGEAGPWANKPGQDLLAQSISGMPWLNGRAGDPPVPVGLAFADTLASCHLAEGITALLFRRERTGRGGLVETSLMEAMFDMQLELLPVYLHDRTKTVRRSSGYGAHAYLGAPYGVFPTADGYLALAMNPVPRIGEILGIDELSSYTDPESWMGEREVINDLIAQRLRTGTTSRWLGLLEAADAWCAAVNTLEEVVSSEGFAALEMTQEITQSGASVGDEAVVLEVTRSPLRIDGKRLTNTAGSPRLGEHNEAVRTEMERHGAKNGKESKP